MMFDTSTAEGRAKRLDQIARGYLQLGNWRSLVSLIGLSNSDRDYQEADAGEPPAGAVWN